MPTAFDFTPGAPDGTPHPLAAYAGRVLLIVNTASRCGFTPQYAGLEALWRQHKEAGLTVLGFPCNQFAHQEPGSAGDIATFCSANYDVSFPILAKTLVNGPGADPLYRWLKEEKAGLLGLGAIKWNFTKFLIGRDGRVQGRFPPTASPESLQAPIAAALAAPQTPAP